MKKLLLIEDDQFSAQSLAEQLSDSYQVEVAQGGEAGLHQAQDFLPDMILLDIMLPGKMNGFDVLRELKQGSQTAQIPVIMLTNLDDQKAAALEFGAVDCLVKANTKIEQILDLIHSCLTHSTQKTLDKKAST